MQRRCGWDELSGLLALATNSCQRTQLRGRRKGNRRLVLSRSVGHDANVQLREVCGAKGKVTKIPVVKR